MEELFLYAICYEYLGIYTANFIAIATASMTSFLANSRLNFRKTDKAVRRYVKFMIVVCIGLVLSNLQISLLLPLFSPVMSKLISIPLVVIVQYTLSKLWVYRSYE